LRKYIEAAASVVCVIVCVVTIGLFIGSVFDLVDSIKDGTFIPGRREEVQQIFFVGFGAILIGVIIALSVMFIRQNLKKGSR